MLLLVVVSFFFFCNVCIAVFCELHFETQNVLGRKTKGSSGETKILICSDTCSDPQFDPEDLSVLSLYEPSQFPMYQVRMESSSFF